MKKYLVGTLSAALAALTCSVPAYAFTSHDKSTAISVTGSGVTSQATVDATVVTQGTADTAATLSFGAGNPNALVDSGEALKVTVSANVPANRVIIYTDNSAATASPKYCGTTAHKNTPAHGFDGGGLVGTGSTADPNDSDNCESTIPLLWVVLDSNDNHTFTTASVGDDEAFITDRAHTHTFTGAVISGTTAADETEREELDALVMRNCTTGVLVSNPNDPDADPEVYPQDFGDAGASQDLCNASGVAVTIAGKTFQNCAAAPCAADTKVTYAEELSKNIAVVAFGCSGTNPGTTCTAPDLATPAIDTKSVVSPFYLPIAGDFRAGLSNISYAQNTLQLELVSQ